MDEAASKIRTEIDSMPTELDEISRKIMQLEIEKQALGKETDRASKARLATLEKELSQLKEENASMRAQWENEKKAITELKGTKEQIEEVKRQIEDAERSYDLEKLAQLKYGTLPELEKKLAAEKHSAEHAEENRLLKEEVGEEEIAEVVSGWTGIPVAKLVESEKEKALKRLTFFTREVIGQEEGGSCRIGIHPEGKSGAERRKQTDRILYFPGTYRCRKNRACQSAFRIPL